MPSFRLGCGETVDYIIDDATFILVQDVIAILDLLGQLVSYEPAVGTDATPVYIEQEAA